MQYELPEYNRGLHWVYSGIGAGRGGIHMDGCIALGVYRYSERGWWFPAVYKQWLVEIFNFDSALSSLVNPHLQYKLYPPFLNYSVLLPKAKSPFVR
jgi:hypothetical protein